MYTKPCIEKGACYQCGSTAHQRLKCPDFLRTKTKQEEPSNCIATTEEKSSVINVNYERPSSNQDHPGSYEATCECTFSVDPETSYGITFVPIIDTDNPISLLKRELLPHNYDIIKPLRSNCIFFGINGTKIELLGIFKTKIFVNGNKLDLYFYIIPRETMSTE